MRYHLRNTFLFSLVCLLLERLYIYTIYRAACPKDAENHAANMWIHDGGFSPVFFYLFIYFCQATFYEFLVGIFNSFMVDWAFQALSELFKFLTSGEKKQRHKDEGKILQLKTKVYFPWNVVQWCGIVFAFCVFWCQWPHFNQMVKTLQASAFTVWVGLPRITMSQVV